MDLSAAQYAERDADRLAEVLVGPPVTWVFLGDSITQSLAHTHGARGFVEHFTERVRGELGRLSDAVVNSGTAGARTEDVLGEFDWRAGRFAPDVVFVMFGTNDRQAGADGVPGYRFRLDQIVQRSRDLGATVVLQTPPPVLGPQEPPAGLGGYVEAVRSVAADLGVVLVDHAAHWATAAATTDEGAAREGWFDDPSHPNARGHHEMARTVFRTLGIDDDTSPVCSLFGDSASDHPA